MSGGKEAAELTHASPPEPRRVAPICLRHHRRGPGPRHAWASVSTHTPPPVFSPSAGSAPVLQRGSRGCAPGLGAPLCSMTGQRPVRASILLQPTGTGRARTPPEQSCPEGKIWGGGSPGVPPHPRRPRPHSPPAGASRTPPCSPLPASHYRDTPPSLPLALTHPPPSLLVHPSAVTPPRHAHRLPFRRRRFPGSGPAGIGSSPRGGTVARGRGEGAGAANGGGKRTAVGRHMWAARRGGGAPRRCPPHPRAMRLPRQPIIAWQFLLLRPQCPTLGPFGGGRKHGGKGPRLGSPAGAGRQGRRGWERQPGHVPGREKAAGSLPKSTSALLGMSGGEAAVPPTHTHTHTPCKARAVPPGRGAAGSGLAGRAGSHRQGQGTRHTPGANLCPPPKKKLFLQPPDARTLKKLGASFPGSCWSPSHVLASSTRDTAHSLAPRWKKQLCLTLKKAAGDSGAVKVVARATPRHLPTGGDGPRTSQGQAEERGLLPGTPTPQLGCSHSQCQTHKQVCVPKHGFSQRLQKQTALGKGLNLSLRQRTSPQPGAAQWRPHAADSPSMLDQLGNKYPQAGAGRTPAATQP